jgi:hypothetical protein
MSRFVTPSNNEDARYASRRQEVTQKFMPPVTDYKKKKPGALGRGIGYTIVALVALFTYFGVPFLAWHFLHPVGFWQEVFLVVGTAMWTAASVMMCIVVFGGAVAIISES